MTIKLKSLHFVRDAPAKPKHAAWPALSPAAASPSTSTPSPASTAAPRVSRSRSGSNVRLTGLDFALASLDLARHPGRGGVSQHAEAG